MLIDLFSVFSPVSKKRCDRWHIRVAPLSFLLCKSTFIIRFFKKQIRSNQLFNPLLNVLGEHEKIIRFYNPLLFFCRILDPLLNIIRNPNSLS